jgi:HlyD family secretion protein
MKPAVMESAPGDVLDFAPGLLAIQEHPPARMPSVVLYSVLALFTIMLSWALLGKLDVVASAEGRLVPQTYVKIVQPAEAGIVQEILVHEGQTVEAGQVLMRMDAKLADADARTLAGEFALKRLQLRRIDAELAGAPMRATADDALDLFARVASQYAAHRQVYQDTRDQEQALLDKTRHELRAAQETAQKLRETVPSYRNSASAFEALGRDGFYSPLAVEEKQRDRIEKEQDQRAQEAAVASLASAIVASEKKLAQIASGYRSELYNERIETESQFRRLHDDLEKTEHKSGLLALRAPQRGVVKDLATHTPGTVVSPGTVLMSLVPQDDPLQAEVLVRNEDMGFVRVDQRVRIKLAAYPFQKYGMINGTVVHVGPDAADVSGGSARSAGETPDPASGLRYKALIRLDTQHLEADGRRLRLSPGMQAVAEIHQGRRTVIEYLLSPVQKAWQEAARER